MRTLRSYILILSLLIISNNVKAVPAKPGLISVRQTDGTELLVRIVGDEHFHYYLTEDGYLLINDNDTYYYSDVDSNGRYIRSQYVARPADQRQAQEKAWLANVDKSRLAEKLTARAASSRKNAQRRNVGLFDTGFPSKGAQKGIVVLVEYQDTKFTLDDPFDYFNRMLNENGFNDYGGTGCATEYFRKSSMSQFIPEFDVFGPITLSKSMSYYGANGWGGDDQNPEQMVIEACQQLDATVDFSEYDRDNDGYIDNVFVFYAGRGEASGGSANTVWPHSWNVTAATSTPYYFDGVQLDRYACSNEWEGSHPDGVGTFIHEFSHVLGLPDLYATSYTSAFTPGAWSVLDYGPYNNDGRTPPLYSIYERYSLGWIEPAVIDGPANIKLDEISSNKGCIIKTEKEDEFFLIENRQQKGWDEYIPGHGMLVWHVDFNDYVWNSNSVNNLSSHQYVDLEEADGTQNEFTRDGDSFPGASNITSFTDDTKPSMKSWGGHRQELPITDITETNGIISFKVAGGIVPPGTAVADEATDVTPVSFTANWQAAENATDYLISVYTKNDGETQVYVSGYNKKNVGNNTSVEVTGLEQLTTYYYKVTASNEGTLGEESNEITVNTTKATFDFKVPVATAATDVKDNSFTANWQTMEDATEYTISVYTKEFGEPNKDVCDFTGGVNNLPEGWKSNSTQSYANKSYSGEAIPSLRLIQTGNYIESALYPLPVRRLSFWHRGSNAAEDNRIVVSAQTKDSKWTDIATLEIVNTAGGIVTTIDEVPDDTYKIRITYSMPGKGSLALDDVKIFWGGDETVTGEIQKTMLPPAESLDIDKLSPGTTYYYRVQATDGTLVSKWSNEIKVTTTNDNTSAIGLAGTEKEAAINLSGDLLTISGVNGEAVTVSDVYGRQVFSTGKSSGDSIAVRLPSRGIYVVRTGQSKTIKIKR